MEAQRLSKLSIGDICRIHKPAYEGRTVTVVSLPGAKNGNAYGVKGVGVPDELPFRREELELIENKQK